MSRLEILSTISPSALIAARQHNDREQGERGAGAHDRALPHVVPPHHQRGDKLPSPGRTRTSLARLAAVVVDERARCRDHADVQLRRTAELQRSAAELLAAGATLE